MEDGRNGLGRENEVSVVDRTLIETVRRIRESRCSEILQQVVKAVAAVLETDI